MPENHQADQAPAKKSYGLPADYSNSQYMDPVKSGTAKTVKNSSDLSKKLITARTAMKKKIANMQESRRAAKAAEAERQRILAREAEARKAEAARRAEEAAKKAEHDAKLEAAVVAKNTPCRN